MHIELYIRLDGSMKRFLDQIVMKLEMFDCNVVWMYLR